jgi:hypothetical protein
VQSCALSATLTLLTVCNCFACREIANPYGDLKQNRFLQKTITIDVKNLNSKCEAYQEVLGMIAERDQLLFEKETANISLFDAKKASEDTRIQALSAEMEVDLARNALLSRQVQLKYLLDKTQAQEVKDELEKVSDKLKEMVLAATTLATSAQQYIAEVQDLRRLATKTSTTRSTPLTSLPPATGQLRRGKRGTGKASSNAMRQPCSAIRCRARASRAPTTTRTRRISLLTIGPSSSLVPIPPPPSLRRAWPPHMELLT